MYLGAGLASVFTERPLGEADLDAIGAVGAKNVHHAFVGARTRPILLQFEGDL